MGRLRARHFVILVLVFLRTGVSKSPVSAGEEQELLATIKAGHQAARESIRSLSAFVTIEQTFPQSAKIRSGHYWRSLRDVRVEEATEHGSESFLLSGSEIWQVGRSHNPQTKLDSYGAARRAPGDLFCMCDVWREMLIELPGPAGGQFEFNRFLEFAKEPPTLKRVKLDGHECIRLTMQFDTTTGVETKVTLWHDIACNYLIRKLEATYNGPASRGDAEIVEFAEFPNGVFVPMRCRRSRYDHGKKISVSITELSNVAVNINIDKDVMKLPAIPSGTLLQDSVNGTRYPVNSEWKAIGPAQPLTKFTVAGPADNSGAEFQTQSLGEAGSSIVWLFVSSMGILIIAGVGWLYRRRRATKEVAGS